MVSSVAMEFTKKLRMLLKRRRISQEILASEIGVSQNKVSLWANGRNLPDIREAAAIARVLDVDVNYLADDGLDEMPKPTLSRDQDYVLRYFDGSGLSADVAVQRMRGIDIVPSPSPGDAAHTERKTGPEPKPKRNDIG